MHRQLGAWRVHSIRTGGMWLDGGAMFGVIPKPLWEKKLKADDRNRIPMCMRTLVIEHDIGPIIIETGAGNKESEKFYDIYGIDNRTADGRTGLEAGLASIGIATEKVPMVIDTHLHFDHAGGNTYRDHDGQIRLTFPNARYVVQAGEYHYATHTNERTAGSYFDDNFVPVEAAGRFDMVRGEREIVPGVTVMPVPGHTPHLQGVLVESQGEALFFITDLVPTTAHLPLPWIMGYDVEPLVTLETKRRILPRAAEEGWLLAFPHDAATPWSRIRREGNTYTLDSPAGTA
ncbi:MAG TPA: MBL fold metallo-hydrolase [Gemmatimonadaceae bacterium]|nr:MBL fold metallo-hydrolase [Gemmatimonadaceae bacterium]